MNGMELKKLVDVTVAKAIKEFAEKLKSGLEIVLAVIFQIVLKARQMSLHILKKAY